MELSLLLLWAEIRVPYTFRLLIHDETTSDTIETYINTLCRSSQRARRT